MTEENKGTILIILAIVAIVAIVGLILLFNGSITGAATAAASSDATCRVAIVPAESDFGGVRVSGGAIPKNVLCWLPKGCSSPAEEYTALFVPTDAANKICGTHGGGKTCPVNDGTCEDRAILCAYPAVSDCQNGVGSCVTCGTTGGGKCWSGTTGTCTTSSCCDGYNAVGCQTALACGQGENYCAPDCTVSSVPVSSK